MSNDDELEKIRRRKLEELQQQAAQQQVAESQQKDFEEKKYLLMRKILSVEGRQRLENIRIVKPQYAEQIEIQLIQLFQSGKLRGAIPLPDKAFKNLLEQLSNLERKKEFKIKK
ncbi:MAG: DNA-binding protein [Candidatus Lokiarchaeota archaeon]|nr:DNA-binding protein [Candidatus Lokiarchaeota archaeon]